MGYTNSSLVNYTRISKNSNPRTGKICRISPHCMAGNLSVETCGNVFANGKASSNYGIGSDGRVAMYVEEKNRSWCTSSKDNDHQAVTIEVANSAGASQNWPVSGKAWDSLVLLCADICQRNGKTRLVWFGDKNKTLAYKPADDEMIITAHRWFAAKACPGDYLYNRMNELATTVTSMLGTSNENENKHPEIDETPQVVTVTDEAYLWNELGTIIANDYGKAGVMGNLFAESGLQSNNLQNSFEKKLGYTDAAYTAAVDNGSYKNFVRDGAGYGLAQWTYWSRKEGLLKYANGRSQSVGDFKTQVGYLKQELTTIYKGLIPKLNACKSVREASDLMLKEFEKPADQGEMVQVARANYSTHFYNMYAAKCKFPYTVRVTCNDLNIRKEPSNKAAKNGKITDRGIYTIMSEHDGPGANKWGKLKSGKGYISLDYTEKT